MSPRDGGALLSTHTPAQFRSGGLATVNPLRDARGRNGFSQEPGSRALWDPIGPLGKLDSEDFVCLDVVQDRVRAEVDELAQFGWRVERFCELHRHTSSGWRPPRQLRYIAFAEVTDVRGWGNRHATPSVVRSSAPPGS